jgi:hypothetical protein
MAIHEGKRQARRRMTTTRAGRGLQPEFIGKRPTAAGIPFLEQIQTASEDAPGVVAAVPRLFLLTLSWVNSGRTGHFTPRNPATPTFVSFFRKFFTNRQGRGAG